MSRTTKELVQDVRRLSESANKHLKEAIEIGIDIPDNAVAGLIEKLDALELAHDKLTQASHTRNLRQKAMQPLFIFINNIGDVRVEESPDALTVTPEWRQIATVDPKNYLEKILNGNVKLVAALMMNTIR